MVDVEARLGALEQRVDRLEKATRALETLPHSMGMVQASLQRLVDAITAQSMALELITKAVQRG
jgi:hypothetical protein